MANKRLSTGIFHLLLSATLLYPAANATRPTIEDVKREIAGTPEKAGGIYFAYPFNEDVCPEPPVGYEPFMVNHYGRHGSRWALKKEIYENPIAQLEKGKTNNALTPLGEEVLRRVTAAWENARGNLGSLSPLGERQHKGIAERMMNRFPSLFSGTDTLTAYSSTVPRCIVSMAAFCERLKEKNPSLNIKRHVSDGNMDFIAYSTPEAKALGQDDADWKKDFYLFKINTINPDRVVESLFTDTRYVKNRLRLVSDLFDVAISLQDIDDLGFELLSLFTPDELFDLWQASNYNMYVRHANSSISHAGPESAASLLTNFLETTDKAIRDNKGGVTLRFGHDTNLIRLVTLMGIEGCDEKESSPSLFATAWQSYRVSPMAANLQLTLYRNAEGDVICLPRLNERPVKLPLESLADADGNPSPFYKWETLRNFWYGKISDLK